MEIGIEFSYIREKRTNQKNLESKMNGSSTMFSRVGFEWLVEHMMLLILVVVHGILTPQCALLFLLAFEKYPL